MERWVSVLDEWSSYSLDQLDYMSLPQGHPLFIRRENLRRQKQRNEDDEDTQSGEMDQLLHDPLEEATLREIGAQFVGRSQATKARRKDDAHEHVARARTNTQKYVDERYVAKALTQAATQHLINDKNQDDTIDKMEEDNELCSEDPAMQDVSASA